MELKPGYKQTEVGVIPEDWEAKQLVLLGLFTKGKGIRKNEADSGDLPCVRYGEIYTHYNDIVRNYNSHISRSVAGTSKRLKKGDILFAGSGETKEDIGKAIAYVNDDEAYAGGDIVILSPRSASSEFLGYILNAPFATKQKASKAQGDAVVHISALALGSVVIPLPSFPEQRAIAEALSDVDALLESLDQLITKKRNLKQAAMQELLIGKTRLPGFDGEWDVKLINDFAVCTAGGTPATYIAEYWGGSIRWMSSGELNQKRITDVNGRITDFGLNNSSARLLPARCVLIGLAGQGKTRGTVAMNFVELSTNQSIAAILPNESFVSEYLYFNLDARYEELRELSSGGSGRGGLNLKLIKSLAVAYPSKEEQTAIATILSDMDAEINALEQRRKKTRNLKQAMMQELLTGKTRLI